MSESGAGRLAVAPNSMIVTTRKRHGNASPHRLAAWPSVRLTFRPFGLPSVWPPVRLAFRPLGRRWASGLRRWAAKPLRKSQ
jgi:hypothetical protein